MKLRKVLSRYFSSSNDHEHGSMQVAQTTQQAMGEQQTTTVQQQITAQMHQMM